MNRVASDKAGAADASYTAPAEHSTAARLGKEYAHEFPPSADADKRPERTGDGAISSGRYARQAAGLVDCVTPDTLPFPPPKAKHH